MLKTNVNFTHEQLAMLAEFMSEQFHRLHNIYTNGNKDQCWNFSCTKYGEPLNEAWHQLEKTYRRLEETQFYINPAECYSSSVPDSQFQKDIAGTPPTK